MDFSAFNPRTSNPLNLAARSDDVASLAKLLDGGRNPNCNDNRGWTALHEAAANDSVACLRKLLDCPLTAPLAETFEGETALLLACRRKCSLATILLLLERIETVAEYVSNESVSPLHVEFRADVVEALISHGALLDVQDYGGDTPLHEAVRAKRPQIVDLLLHAGAEPEMRNAHGLTPFLTACFVGCSRSVRLLYPFVSDLNDCAYDGNTALILASRQGHADIVHFLLSHGADPDIANDDNCPPLRMAMLCGHADILETLLERCDLAAVGPDLFSDACKPHHFKTDVLVTLLRSDRLPPELFNEPDAFRPVTSEVLGARLRYAECAPLCAVLNVADYVFKSSPELAEALLMLTLSKGADVDAYAPQECPPLVYLHYVDHADCFPMVIQILISQGCNVDYATIKACDNIVIPDAIRASVEANCITLCLLLKYSLRIDPEHIIKLLIEYNMIGQRISLQIIKKLLPDCYLSVGTLEKLTEQLRPYLDLENSKCTLPEFDALLVPNAAPLKHLCRRCVRERLRQNVPSTRDFMNALCTLPIPQRMQDYLRFL